MVGHLGHTQETGTAKYPMTPKKISLLFCPRTEYIRAHPRINGTKAELIIKDNIKWELMAKKISGIMTIFFISFLLIIARVYLWQDRVDFV